LLDFYCQGLIAIASKQKDVLLKSTQLDHWVLSVTKVFGFLYAIKEYGIASITNAFRCIPNLATMLGVGILKNKELPFQNIA
jgi:hypothetical protein